MQAMRLDITVIFYNPNIHPHQKYDRRKNENKRFSEKLNIPFIDADYDSTSWFARKQGMENELERGARKRAIRHCSTGPITGVKAVVLSGGLS